MKSTSKNLPLNIIGQVTNVTKISNQEYNSSVVNSLSKRYPKLRQMSKAPTFALTYGGTYLTLMKNCGFDEPTAKQIESNYHNLYKVSDAWVQKQLQQASINGYITTGFGLRVRTPLLKQYGYHNKDIHIVAAESRTAGNALGQGWGVLNDRAMNEVLGKIDEMGLSESILPVAKIHDACYYLVKNDINLVLLLNELVTKAARWQEHPLIAHDKVHIHGALDLFYPDWAHPITLPENCTKEELLEIVKRNAYEK